jgi:hypothetical protein
MPVLPWQWNMVPFSDAVIGDGSFNGALTMRACFRGKLRFSTWDMGISIRILNTGGSLGDSWCSSNTRMSLTREIMSYEPLKHGSQTLYARIMEKIHHSLVVLFNHSREAQ